MIYLCRYVYNSTHSTSQFFFTESVTQLKKEMAEFQNQRDEELKRLNEYKTQETKKLKQDRKLFEAWQKQQQVAASKKDKQEIEGS